MRVLFQWFLPEELRRDRQAQRAVIFGFAMVFWAPIFAPIYYGFGSTRGSIFIALAGISILAAVLSLRFTKSIRLTGHLIAGAVFATFMGLGTVTGGIGSPSLWWLPAVPIIGLLLCGTHAGVSWAITSCAACVVFLFIDLSGVTIPEEISAENMRLLNTAATSGIILCAFSLTLAFKLGEDASRHELEMARNESDQANQAKSMFLANMSHEIRTPMNAIIGMTELLLDSKLTDTQRDYLSTVLHSGESLLTIIDEILNFSKIEAGKITIASDPLDLRGELNDVVKTLEPRAHEKSLQLECRIDQDVPQVVFGDAIRLRQVMLNLVGNAIKFTATGEVLLSVDVDQIDDARVHLRFSVRDTGIGIATGDLNHIFEEFQQADLTTTRKYGGTGLGLTISSRLVDLMGGRIQVESEVGRGTKFTFSLPMKLCKGEHNLIRQEPSPPDPPWVAEARGDTNKVEDPQENSTLNILLAEDGKANQQLAAGLLRKWGHEVSVADNGQAAVQIWQQGSFDLILMDVQMPELDGIEATQVIRGMEVNHGGHIPIIALTAHAFDEDRERCLAAGMDDFLTKPLRVRELQEMLGKIGRRQNKTTSM